MADNTKIEWTDATWNPITGCSVVSPGCTNCYAMRLAGTRLQHHPSRAGLTRMSKAGPVWNGKVRLNEDWLSQPFRWRRSRKVFVCAHGDLFHENVPDEWIDRVFAVMTLSRQHQFQVLTKRAKRMREYMSAHARRLRILEAHVEGHPCGRVGRLIEFYAAPPAWPPRNVWLGVSVEDQARADERIPLLLETPAAVRFLSCEPLLGPVNLTVIALGPSGVVYFNALVGYWRGGSEIPTEHHRLDWVIVGGESGPHARDMDPDWARFLRDQCAATNAAFFMKQMAHKAPIPDDLMIRQFPALSSLEVP